MTSPLGRVLIIAGSDSGGGAGVQADIKAVTALGGYAATAITAITVQNTLGVHGVHPLPLDLIEAQARAVLDDIGADAIKTGMLGSTAVVERVAAILDSCAAPAV
ncbi:MAG TPA: bifunctional hydroxymethylpyrimidine kinase/phosphomethylpyrimidine kinase, partial [Brevundimonas sp.]|uniref:bifunctional hydroxymethylpyrimidine kinase/phosphomethylpyrimidine kinase n=1 Tax=Brevundimonas sp. TaxID=1871086 RepID=UPI002EDAE32F